MLQRPAYLRNRQLSGRVFGEAVELVSVTGSRTAAGVWAETEVRSSIRAATAPPSNDLARQITEAGIQLDGARTFWTASNITPTTATSPGDVLIWGGDRWRASVVRDWGGFLEVLAVREEGQ